MECHDKIVAKSAANIPPPSEESRRKTAERTRNNPKTGKFQTNAHAKEYSLKSPQGEVFQFRNLSYFVRGNLKLFKDFPAYGALGKINVRSVMVELFRLCPWAKNKRDKWHGWTWHTDPDYVQKIRERLPSFDAPKKTGKKYRREWAPLSKSATLQDWAKSLQR